MANPFFGSLLNSRSSSGIVCRVERQLNLQIVQGGAIIVGVIVLLSTPQRQYPVQENVPET